MSLIARVISRWLVRFCVLAMMCGTLAAPPAAGQSTRSFSNTTSGGINSLTTCLLPLVRNFTVTSNFVVGDVDLGVLASHAWRGDISITLQSPAGTRQTLVTGNGIASGDNFNVRLNDGGTQLVNTDNPDGNHSTAGVPPYQNNFIPEAPLSVFNGQTSAGTWRLEICDTFSLLDDGTFLRADLFLTPQTSSSGTGAIFVVSSTADSGTRTLRQAVIDANAIPGEADTISFAIPGTGPHTITLASPLPPFLGSGDTLDGTTQPGSSCGNLWAGTPHNLRIHLTAGTIGTGLHLEAANLTVRGLAITGFSTKVYTHPLASNVAIRCNYIGLLPNGTRGSGTSLGVRVDGAGTVIGGLNPGEGNVVSGNATAVFTTSGSSDTAIRGNFIGTDPTGMSIIANDRGINNLSGTATWRDITRNLISGNNGPAGIALETDDRVSPSDGQIRIQSNIIGTNRTQTALLRNSGDGIFFDASSITGVLIGGTAATEGNIITANQDGIDMRSVSGVTIRGNTIALALARGIWLDNVSNVTIGGDAATQGNSIGGNGNDGIQILNNSSNITITGNLIRPIATIGGTFANADHGIVLVNTSNVTIGNGTASGRNVIAGNGRRGIFGVGTNSGITINGNYIGTDLTGNVAVANGQNEGAVTRDAISFDGGGNASNIAILNNVIGGYSAALVEFWTSTTNGVTIQGNNIGVGANGSSQIVSGNGEDLVYFGGGSSHSNILIGGSAAGQGNTIAFSSRSGIRLESSGSNIQVIGNTIRNNSRNGIYLAGNTRAAIVGNRIFGNTLIGIDLGENGVTANDPGDGDAGPNDQLNFPVIAGANTNGSNILQYNFTLDAPAAANGYRIDFFANAAGHFSGFGEGERFIGSIDIVHPGGSHSYSGNLTTIEPVSVNERVTATTTRKTAGGAWDITSEFSAVATAGGIAQLAVQIASQVFDPPAANPFATPGNDIVLTATVTNTGNGSTDADSIFAVLSIDQANVFHNAATPAFGGVIGFTSGSPGLTFTPSTDLRFSNNPAPPTGFAQCTYTPAAGYDPQVRHVCLNPKGTMPGGSPAGQFEVRLRARIN